MKINKTLTALVAGASIGMSGQAFAANGTASNTTISNEAVLTYKVGSIDQDPERNTADFIVATKVDFTVDIGHSSLLSVTPNSNDYVLTYTVTNDGNATFDFSLAATQISTGTDNFVVGLGSTTYSDNTSMDNVEIHIDDGDGVYETDGSDPIADYLDEITADDTVDVTFFIVSDAPLTMTDDQIAGIDVTVTALEGGSASTKGSTITATPLTTAFDNTALQIVVANSGTALAGGYQAASAVLTVDKQVTVINDPICASADSDYRTSACTNDSGYLPKAIPGATLEYTIVIANDATASTSAVSLILTDDLNIDGTDTGAGDSDDIDVTTLSARTVDTSNLTDIDFSDTTTAGIINIAFDEIHPDKSATITFTVELL
jgi:hypothetical protein